MEGVSVTHVLFSLLKLALAEVEASDVTEHLCIALVGLDAVKKVLLSLCGVALQELFLISEARVALLQSLANLSLDQMITFALSLVNGDSDAVVELILLRFHHLSDSQTHLLHEEDVQLRVEAVLVVLVEALNASLLAKVLFNNTHNRLLHSFLKDMVLAGLVKLIKVLLFALFIGINLLLSAHSGGSLLLEVAGKHLVVLAR